MNRIEQKFSELKSQKKKAFLAFLTAGDPNLKTTEALALNLEKSGVDILELGVPFSDPMADGPVIQKSSERALKAGTTLEKVLGLVTKIRRRSQMPILLMGYYNPIHAYGVEKFFKQAKKSGVDGALIVDLPPEEAELAQKAAKQHGVSLIFLLAPTSTPERISQAMAQGSGFIYYVSLTGITGAALSTQLKSHKSLKLIKKNRKLPVAVGFGIKTPLQAKQTAEFADGVVVGSALVELGEKYRGAQFVQKVSNLAARLAKAVHAV